MDSLTNNGNSSKEEDLKPPDNTVETEEQELNRDTVSTKTKKKLNLNHQFVTLISRIFYFLKASGQEELADITEQKSPNGTGNASPQIEGSPKSSSRKRSVNFLTNFMHFHGKFSKEIYF